MTNSISDVIIMANIITIYIIYLWDYRVKFVKDVINTYYFIHLLYVTCKVNDDVLVMFINLPFSWNVTMFVITSL